MHVDIFCFINDGTTHSKNNEIYTRIPVNLEM